MNNEHAFNQYLGRELKKLRPYIYHLKASEKFHRGISDFLIWRGGKCAVLEVKFIRDLGKETSNLLKHSFTGPQQTFLQIIDKTGTYAWGLIAIKSEQKMYLIPQRLIPMSGNWKNSDFKLLITKNEIFEFSFVQVRTLIDHIFKD